MRSTRCAPSLSPRTNSSPASASATTAAPLAPSPPLRSGGFPLAGHVPVPPSPTDVDRCCHELFLSPRAQETDDNLLFVRERLLKSEADRAGLLDLYSQVRGGRRVPD